MADYAELQAEHQRLLHLLDQNPKSAELPGQVKAYVNRARTESTFVGAPRDRDQLRANLRFWGSFLFDQTGEYPDTSLRPPAAGAANLAGPTAPTGETWSQPDIDVKTEPQPVVQQPPPPLPARSRSPAAIIGAAAGVLVLGALLCVAVFLVGMRLQAFSLGPSPSRTAFPQTATAAATRTAAVIVTPLPSATPGTLPETQTPLASVTVATATAGGTVVATLTPAPTGGTVLAATETAVAACTASNLAATASAATATAAAGHGTPPPTAPPGPTGSAPLPYQRLQLLAQVSQPSEPVDCAHRGLEIDADPGGALAAADLGEAQVVLTRMGGDNLTTMPFANKMVLDLATLDPDHNPTLLLQVEHPKLTFASVILQFSADCTHNQVVVNYVAQNAPSFLTTEPARSPDLDLTWEMENWGPSPTEPQQWVALLKLDVQGGSDRQLIFWDGKTALPNGSLLVAHQGCDPERRLIGVSSGGEAVLREIVIQLSTCQ